MPVAAEDHGELRADQIRHAGQEGPEVDAGIRQPLHRWKHITRAALGEQREYLEVGVFRHQSERIPHAIGRHRGHIAERQHLVGQRQRIPHRAIRRAGDHRDRIVVRAHAFLAQHVTQPIPNVRRTDALEIEPLQPAQHGRGRLRDLLWLGRREYEHDARRRLLEHLE